MGNIFSISISWDDILSRCWDSTVGQIAYPCMFKSHLHDLQTALEELTDLKNDLKRRVDNAEQQQHLKRLDQVQRWITRVEAMEAQANNLVNGKDIRSQKVEKLRDSGGGLLCNCKTHYKLGKKLAKMLMEVSALQSRGAFEVVAERVPAAMVYERSIEPTVDMQSTFGKVWDCIEDEQVGIIGLYGMGGVGKTTLLTKINNNFLHTPNDFDLVIWIEVSKDLKLENIQDSIGEKIGSCDGSWKDKDHLRKAEDIFAVLKSKRFVLLLDDIWERVDVAKIGVPIPDRENKSKLVFTTRSEEVCSRMGAHKKIKVECLAWDRAWTLFQEKVGEETLYVHPDIPALAEMVAKECDGLPLALITVGRAMASKKTPQEWNHAIQVLKRSASEFSGMGDEVFPLLKFSYDNLPSEKARSCFLYCALFPEDFLIHKRRLIYCWVGEGILDEYDDMTGAQNQRYDIIGTLVNACLLEGKEDYVKMHDVLRDMALWLACECGKAKDNFIVRTGAHLIKAPDLEKWKGVKRMSLMANQIENLVERSTCPSLSTLLLTDNHLKIIGEGFFQHMPSLRVLDLSENKGITHLPPGISKLKSLQYLNLSQTGIRGLPVELKAFDKLKYLNLEFTSKMDIVPKNVISSFLMLRVLRMYDCGSSDDILFGGEEALVEELVCLKHLDVMTMTMRCVSAFERLWTSLNLLACTQVLCIESFTSVISLDISALANMKHLDILNICDCESLEDLKTDLLWNGGAVQVPNDPCNSIITIKSFFHSLQRVSVYECPKLKDLTWLIFAPNLVTIDIHDCPEMEQIINSRQLSKIEEVVDGFNSFAKLNNLILLNLSKLKNIYANALPSPYLKTIVVFNCPQLKQLPLDSSVNRRNVVIEGEEEWWNGLEWEDGTTRNDFISCFRNLNI
ncbi:hypothetical protein C1H46_043834 [Malus baccata]|uniref:Uncharacterized protein n=1 Tax=Malus baccata TaxID=106549 RepID=A0A540K8U8_MALBA|nr:hypothetical protein C1H46_043834 [Malus baccata]